MRLILIRHGQTQSNVLGLLDTAEPGPSLTDLGVSQAEALPRALANERIDAVFASTTRRAQETATPLTRDRSLALDVHAGLREVQAGDLEMRGDGPSIRTYLMTLGAWMEGDLESRMPGGPSGASVLERFDDAVATVQDRVYRDGGADGHAVVVAHGAVLRLWASLRARNLDDMFGAKRPLHNTGMIVMRGDVRVGWVAETWAGEAMGGPSLDDPQTDGPAGDVAPVPDGDTTTTDDRPD